MLRDFTPRLYQQTILGTAAQKNTLVVLPTGLGKTALAFLLAAQRLHHYPQSKILLLAPTKPLCEQHVETFNKHLDIATEKIVLFTGATRPEKRAELWNDAQIIISTPQGLENDVINRRIKLEEVSLLIFDEAHHATGEYAYVWVAKQYENTARYARILALTASPGSDLEKIKEVCQNLHIERVEVRTESDPDVKPYIQHVKINWIPVDFPVEFQKVQKIFLNCKKNKIIEVQKNGYATSSELSKSDLLGLQSDLHQRLSTGERDFEMMRSVSLLAEALKIEHALELLETQGISPLYSYLSKLRQEAVSSKVKATQNLVLDPLFKEAVYLVEELEKQEINHPKLEKLQELVQEEINRQSAVKIIIFTQFRSSAESIIKRMTLLGIKNHVFVGQAKKNGLGFSQKQQKEILDKFRAGEFNILVATSVAEEGLDIPKVDKVIFYEPVPSAIRSIQRRGRTGRLEEGEVTILMTAKTRDEIYRWSSHHKEKRMYRNLESLKKEFKLMGRTEEPRKNASLQQYLPADPVVAILADHREKNNRVVKELIDLGISVRTAQLVSADYIVSGTVGIELKKVPDFVASIIDGRLLDQVRELKQNFEKSLIIIEGEEDLYAVRNVHPNAIRGMLASIVLDFNLPIIYTKNPQDTAGILAIMARREQDKSRDVSLREHKPRSRQEQLEYITASFPTVGLVNARKLLERFGSLQKLINASTDEITAVDGLGSKTAEKLVKLFTEEYDRKKK